MRATQTIQSNSIYLSVAGVLLLATSIYGIFQFNYMRDYGQALEYTNQTIVGLKNLLETEKSAYKIFADRQSEIQSKLAKKIIGVLPPDENLTDLTRIFDNFFAETDTPASPIFQNSLNYSKGEPVPGMTNISALPVTMSIKGTRENFFKFMDFILNSGSLNTGLRLLSINSVDLNFVDGAEAVDNMRQMIEFSVHMYAYYQTPKIKR